MKEQKIVKDHRHSAPRALATIVSYLFHPVFMPVAMVLLLYRLSPTSFMGISHKQLVFGIISITSTTLFFPLFTIFLLWRLKFISSLQMADPKERIIPLIATMTFYFWACHVYLNFTDATVPLLIKVLLLGCFWGVIGIFMINIFFRISMHTAGAGGMLGILTLLVVISPVNLVLPLFIAIILAGAIGSARLQLGAHSRSEIWLGYLVGFASQIFAYWYVR